MAKRRRLDINVGLRNYTPTRGALYPSERYYVSEMRKQSKMLTDTLLSILDQFEDVSEDIMIEALEPTFEKAKAYTPVNTGTLVDSAYLEKVGFRGKPRVEMGFARGGNPHYAVYVHEMTTIAHNPPTTAKFLEYALKEDLDTIYVRLAHLYYEFMTGKSSGSVAEKPLKDHK